MSSSSSAAPDSRSSSPPPTPDNFDFLDTAIIQIDSGVSNAPYISTQNHFMNQAQLDPHTMNNMEAAKLEDEEMLRLDELLEQHAFEECVSVDISSIAKS
jgi:uncharacterized protein